MNNNNNRSQYLVFSDVKRLGTIEMFHFALHFRLRTFVRIEKIEKHRKKSKTQNGRDASA